VDSIDDGYVVLVEEVEEVEEDTNRPVFIGANAFDERIELLLQMRPTNNIVAFLSGLIIIVVPRETKLSRWIV